MFPQDVRRHRDVPLWDLFAAFLQQNQAAQVAFLSEYLGAHLDGVHFSSKPEEQLQALGEAFQKFAAATRLFGLNATARREIVQQLWRRATGTRQISAETFLALLGKYVTAAWEQRHELEARLAEEAKEAILASRVPPSRDMKGPHAPESNPVIAQLSREGKMVEVTFEQGALAAHTVRYVDGYMPGVTEPSRYHGEPIPVKTLLTSDQQQALLDWIATHHVRGAPVRFRIVRGQAALGWQSDVEHSNIAHAGYRDGVIYMGQALLQYLLTPGSEALRTEVLDRDEYRHLTEPDFNHATEADAYQARLKAVGAVVEGLQFVEDLTHGNQTTAFRAWKSFAARWWQFPEALQQVWLAAALDSRYARVAAAGWEFAGTNWRQLPEALQAVVTPARVEAGLKWQYRGVDFWGWVQRRVAQWSGLTAWSKAARDLLNLRKDPSQRNVASKTFKVGQRLAKASGRRLLRQLADALTLVLLFLDPTRRRLMSFIMEKFRRSHREDVRATVDFALRFKRLSDASKRRNVAYQTWRFLREAWPDLPSSLQDSVTTWRVVSGFRYADAHVTSEVWGLLEDQWLQLPPRLTEALQPWRLASALSSRDPLRAAPAWTFLRRRWSDLPERLRRVLGSDGRVIARLKTLDLPDDGWLFLSERWDVLPESVRQTVLRAARDARELPLSLWMFLVWDWGRLATPLQHAIPSPTQLASGLDNRNWLVRFAVGMFLERHDAFRSRGPAKFAALGKDREIAGGEARSRAKRHHVLTDSPWHRRFDRHLARAAARHHVLEQLLNAITISGRAIRFSEDFGSLALSAGREVYLHRALVTNYARPSPQALIERLGLSPQEVDRLVMLLGLSSVEDLPNAVQYLVDQLLILELSNEASHNVTVGTPEEELIEETLATAQELRNLMQLPAATQQALRIVLGHLIRLDQTLFDELLTLAQQLARQPELYNPAAQRFTAEGLRAVAEFTRSHYADFHGVAIPPERVERLIMQYEGTVSVPLGPSGVRVELRGIRGLEDVRPGARTPDWLATTLERSVALRTQWKQQRRLGYRLLPWQSESMLDEIMDHVERHLQAGVADVVLVGMGGQALGNIALQDILGSELSQVVDAARGHYPRFHVLNNADPRELAALLSRLDPATTDVYLSSKSGDTAEMLLNAHHLIRWLQQTLPEERIAEHLVITTNDVGTGTLAEFADRHHIRTWHIPTATEDVGGRFSVLSPSGLVSAAYAGIDLHQLLAGARSIQEPLDRDVPSENPAFQAALAAYLEWLQGKDIMAITTFSAKVRSFANWLRQLVAESLAKDGRGVFAAIVTGQDAVADLTKGPDDRLFLILNYRPEGLARPEVGGRPSISFELQHLDAFTVGQLLYFFEEFTVRFGALLGIDPLVQPKVQLAKDRFAELAAARRRDQGAARPSRPTERLTLDDAFLFLPGGLTRGQLAGERARSETAFTTPFNQRQALVRTEVRDAVEQYAARYQAWQQSLAGRFEDLVIIGSRPALLKIQALIHAFEPLQAGRPGVRIHYVDDTRGEQQVRDALRHLNPDRTVLQVVSSPDDTPDTVPHYRRFARWLRARPERIVVTTADPQGRVPGFLRGINTVQPLSWLNTQPNLADQSPLSPNDLFPLLVLGADLRGFLEGYASVGQEVVSTMASAQRLLAAQGKKVQLIFPYAGALNDFGSWAKWLYRSRAGDTALLVDSAVGTISQHDILEGLLNGPNTAATFFVKVARDETFSAPADRQGLAGELIPSLLDGYQVQEVANDMQAGVSRALADEGRPNATIIIPELSAQTIGALFGLVDNVTQQLGASEPRPDMAGAQAPAPVWAGDLYPHVRQPHRMRVGEQVDLYATVRVDRPVSPAQVKARVWSNLHSPRADEWQFVTPSMAVTNVYDGGRTYRFKGVVSATQPGQFEWTVAFSTDGGKTWLIYAKDEGRNGRIDVVETPADQRPSGGGGNTIGGEWSSHPVWRRVAMVETVLTAVWTLARIWWGGEAGLGDWLWFPAAFWLGHLLRGVNLRQRRYDFVAAWKALESPNVLQLTVAKAFTSLAAYALMSVAPLGWAVAAFAAATLWITAWHRRIQLQVMAGQMRNILYWIHAGVPGAKELRLTANTRRMVKHKAMSYLDAASVRAAGLAIVSAEGQPGLFDRGWESPKKMGLDHPVLQRFIMYLMVHGWLPVPSGLRQATRQGRISTIHRTAFLHDRVGDPSSGEVHRTSTGDGHAQGRKLDLKYVTAGSGIQRLTDAQGRVHEHRVTAGAWTFALPGYQDAMESTGGLEFDDFSIELTPEEAQALDALAAAVPLSELLAALVAPLADRTAVQLYRMVTDESQLDDLVELLLWAGQRAVLPPSETSQTPGTFGYEDVGNMADDVRRATGDTRLAHLRLQVTSNLPIRAPASYVAGHLLNTEEQRLAGQFMARLGPHIGQPWRGPHAPDISHIILTDYIWFLTNLVTGYYQTGADPYELANGERIRKAVTFLTDSLAEARAHPASDRAGAVKRFLTTLLYANKHEGTRAFTPGGIPIVSDQRDVLAQHLASLGEGATVDLWIDNIGPELAANLQLIDDLLTHHQTATVRVHLKSEPAIVSDVWGRAENPQLPHVAGTLWALEWTGDAATAELARRIRGWLAEGRVRLQRDEF
ncbi:MAG: DUF89 family protein, partial [Candidatus Omnitrophica bacterium]|nr:DUF89 family protein [Candidatus Omnitrophota bacterium]